MAIFAVGFDIGHTLINYSNPLNWKSLYFDALEKVMSDCNIDKTDSRITSAIQILSKYNTREHYREHEVSSDIIFKEIFDSWGKDYTKIADAKESFYGFFQAGAVCFDDTVKTLGRLSAMGIHMGFLTDVAYGMDNKYSLKDIDEIRKYFDAGFTSVDVGFRKPNIAGYKMLLDAFNVSPSRVAYVGDEEKDVIGANNAGMVSVLINRGSEVKNWGQKHTIKSLDEILDII